MCKHRQTRHVGSPTDPKVIINKLDPERLSQRPSSSSLSL